MWHSRKCYGRVRDLFARKRSVASVDSGRDESVDGGCVRQRLTPAISSGTSSHKNARREAVGDEGLSHFCPFMRLSILLTISKALNAGQTLRIR
jgi:hypothetical protein